MNLNDFGTQPPAASSTNGDQRYYEPPGYYAAEVGNRPVQWKIVQSGVFEICGHTAARLPAGAYGCTLNQYGDVQLITRDLQVDDLIDFADSLPAKILHEIENFWDLGTLFQKHGYLHRRGYLLYGPQGSGKSSVVHQVVHRIVRGGHVAVFCEHPGFLTRAMEVFRKIEPDRPVICLFEDIDAVIEIHGDSELLQWLDGSHQINKVINIATTNYPERLDRRIVSRPRRFDRIIKIETPSASIREAYFRKKLPDLVTTGQLTRWVDLTEGLSFAPWQSWSSVWRVWATTSKRRLPCCAVSTIISPIAKNSTALARWVSAHRARSIAIKRFRFERRLRRSSRFQP